jgi:O-antigen/teichoic acid export membrane protein
MRSLTKESATGMFWLLVQSGGTRGITFLSQVLLARLLRPTDFGDVALATSISAVLLTIAGFGIDGVLLSRSSRFSLWAGAAFWASLSLSALGAIVLLAIAPVAAHAYQSPILFGLLAVVASSMPIGALATVPNVALRFQMRFRFLAIYTTAEMFGVQIATILLAWAGLGAFSFVIPTPFAAACKTLVFWNAGRFQMNWHFRKLQIRLLLRSGSAVCGQKLLTSLRENGDYMLLGSTVSHASLGLYYLAFRLAAVPVYALANSLSGALLPALAQLRVEPGRQQRAVHTATRIIALCVIPLSFVQAAVSGPLINLIFGQKWRGAAPLLSILSIGLAFDVVPCVAGALMDANGKFKLQLNWSIVSLPVFFLFIGLGCFTYGVEGVAMGVGLFFLIMGPAYSYFVMRRFDCSVWDILGIYLAPTFSAAFAVGGALWLSKLMPVHNQAVVTIVLVCSVGLSIYVLFVRFISPVVAKDTVDKFSVIWSRAA